MSVRPNFNSTYVRNELGKLSSGVRQEMTLYMAGGAAMALTNLKEATKDIDIVVESPDVETRLVSVLRGLGYKDPHHSLTIVYKRMFARDIVENSDGFRWDIFDRVIANKLHLSEGMIKRSQLYLSSGTLSVRLLSSEDIFLLKSVTDRERDLDDMRTLAEASLDWKSIEAECHWQTAHSSSMWEDPLCNKLHELRAKHNISSPIQKKICREADQRVLEEGIRLSLRGGASTVREVAKNLEQPDATVRAAVAVMTANGIVTVNKTKRPHRVTVNTSS